MKRSLLLFYAFLFLGVNLYSQSNGDYQTMGNVSMTSKTNWQVYNDGWISASAAPTITTAQSNTVTINSGHTLTYDASSANSATWNNLVVNGTLQIGTNTTVRTITINTNLTVSSTAIIDLYSAASTTNHRIYVGGNIQNDGTVNSVVGSAYLNLTINGTIDQTISGSNLLSLYNLTINKSSGTLTLNKSISITNTFTMTAGNIALNNNSITLGSSSTSPGTLSITSGYLTGQGTFTRYINTTNLPTSFSGNIARFPMGYGINDRTLLLKFSSAGITTGGIISVSYSHTEGSTSITSFTDGTKTIDKRSNANWTISQSGLDLGTTTVSVRLNAYGIGGVTSVSDLRLTRGTQAAAGSDGGSSGTTDNPYVSREGLSLSDLANTFYIGATSNSALPVELTDFDSDVNGNKVKLYWNTATEVNNYGFEVERAQYKSYTSTLGIPDLPKNWEKIGFVEGHGNSNSPKDYTFTDQPTGGKDFLYRLKQIDFDGAFEYSKIITASLENVNEFQLEQNYPNPFNPTTRISYKLASRASVRLKVYDLLAQVVAELVDDTQEAGRYEVTFDGSKLPSGTYFYKLEAGQYVEVRKLLLVK